MDIATYVEKIRSENKLCHVCNCELWPVEEYIWKKTIICATCYEKHCTERDELWIAVLSQAPRKCKFCNKIQRHIHDKFHFDHINMFDKKDSICNMIKYGEDLADICIEIDKCQIVCISCHWIITNIERLIGLTKIKQQLTRKLNSDYIDKVEHDAETSAAFEIYNNKMTVVYSYLFYLRALPFICALR